MTKSIVGLCARVAGGAMVLAGCATRGGIDQRALAPIVAPGTPLAIERVPLPTGARATAVWLGAEGSGLIALGDGRILAVDARGGVHAVDRLPGAQAIVAPVSAFAPRTVDEPLGLMAGGAISVQGGLLRRVPLPAFLSDARAFAPFGDGALWATPSGLYATRGDQWITVETAAGGVRDATAILDMRGAAPNDARDAWVLGTGAVRKLRIAGDASPRAIWIDVAPGVDLGAVRAIARMDDTHGAIASGRGITVVGPGEIRTFHGGPADGPPEALGGGGGWAWIGWGGQVLRTDGNRWESLAGGMSFAGASAIAVEDAAGAAALILDATGGVLRIVAADAMRSSGLVDGATLFDTRVEVEALPTRVAGLKSVEFMLDGKVVSVRKEAPWGWATDGSRGRDLKTLAFGAHRLDITGRYDGGNTLRRSLRFNYVSPLGRVPSYATDVAPIFTAHCARCHATGLARDLSSYSALSEQAPLVRASVRESRMPPDILLDPASVAVITAWADGDAPK